MKAGPYGCLCPTLAIKLTGDGCHICQNGEAMTDHRTLGMLRSLCTKAERALPKTKNQKLIHRYYNELASVPGVTVTKPLPAEPDERARFVLDLIVAELHMQERAVMREWWSHGTVGPAGYPQT